MMHKARTQGTYVAFNIKWYYYFTNVSIILQNYGLVFFDAVRTTHWPNDDIQCRGLRYNACRSSISVEST